MENNTIYKGGKMKRLNNNLTTDSGSAIMKTTKKLSFEWYRTPAGGCGFRKYIESLTQSDKAKLLARIIEIEGKGKINMLSLMDSQKNKDLFLKEKKKKLGPYVVNI
jgi:hypothetical protein